MQELERISGMSSEDAKKLLLDQLKVDLQQEANNLIRENENHIKEVSNEKAKEILTGVMQRCVIDHVVESTVASVSLPSDEMKGRIIGREGRNIRTLETLTGVDLIIDDTPEAVVLSCFDPVRREIAKLALEKLVADGRIHPVRIEEMVEKARVEIEQKIKQEGENAAMEIPEAMIDTQARQLVDEFAQRIQAQGLSFEQYLQFTGMNLDTALEQMKPNAVKRIQSRLVLEAVVKAENIEVSEEDVKAEIAKMAETYKMDAEKLAEIMSEEEKKQIQMDMAIEKAVELVTEAAKEV
jgi:enamine deaminase RidA (YjgF/YER057c/UK114 family)